MAIAIQYEQKKLFIENIPGKKLSFLIQQAGISLDLQCSGLGICGKCTVSLGAGHYLISGKKVTLTDGQQQQALACRTEVIGEHGFVSVPQSAILQAKGKIYDEFELKDYQLKPTLKKVHLTIPEPILDAPKSDLCRVKAELKKVCGCKECNDALCSVETLRKLAKVLKTGQSLTVAVGSYQGRCQLIDIQENNTSAVNLAAAVDIGTTTVVLVIVDMNTGKIIARASAYNQQMSRADDVASRISAAATSKEELKYMKDLVINDTINVLLKQACDDIGRYTHEIMRIAISGNTVMAHLFLGLSPESIGMLPFQPLTNQYQDCLANVVGVDIHPQGIVSIIPSVSGYIGGDITSDIYVSDLVNKKELTAIIDLGTNSEMILADNGTLSACAAAAGPAFEGAGIICGCRATDGAIEHISFDSSLKFDLQIIGNAKPIGICGSAIIDFIAYGFRTGLINNMGRYDLDLLKANNCYLEYDICSRKTHACILVSADASGTDQPIMVTESDIEQILKAKAAVYAGLKTLLNEKGYTYHDLKHLILAGGFAKYINLKNAIEIGMLPVNAEAITTSVGNGSLAGAYLSLVDDSVVEKLVHITELPQVVALNTIPEFELNFIDSLMIPHYDETEFQS